MVSCEDVLKLDIAKRFKLVGGKGGIQKPISWVYVCQENYIAPWVNGGELLFLSGIGIQRDEKSLANLVEQSYGKNLSGIIVLINQVYIGSIPKGMIEQADLLEVPLITMP